MQPAIVITGASSGLGAEFARLAAGEGATLVLVARSAAELVAMAQRFESAGQPAVALPLDLTTREAGETLARELAARDLYCDVLVNNAGYGLFGNTLELDRARQLGIVDLNIRAASELMLRFLPEMLQRKRGRILNISSVAGFTPGPRMALYYASKAYLTSLSQAVAAENRNSGVTVTCLCPGPVKTPFLTRAGATKAALFRLVPKQTAEEVARAGWAAMKAGRTVCIPGLLNKLNVLAIELMPRAAVLALVSLLQRDPR
jgi:hypothetical protein